MNLNSEGAGLRFVRVRYDGSDLRTLSNTIPGSGHPTLHADGRHVLTSAEFQARNDAAGARGKALTRRLCPVARSCASPFGRW